METAIISSQQLQETGRWDAPFNIQYQKYRESLLALLASATRDQLLAAAKAIPFNDQAARVRGGSTRASVWDRWTDQELGLYLLQLQDSGEIALTVEQIKADMERKTQELNLVTGMLNQAREKGLIP